MDDDEKQELKALAEQGHKPEVLLSIKQAVERGETYARMDGGNEESEESRSRPVPLNQEQTGSPEQLPASETLHENNYINTKAGLGLLAAATAGGAVFTALAGRKQDEGKDPHKIGFVKGATVVLLTSAAVLSALSMVKIGKSSHAR